MNRDAVEVNRDAYATHGNRYQTFAKSLIRKKLPKAATHATHATHEKGEPCARSRELAAPAAPGSVELRRS